MPAKRKLAQAKKFNLLDLGLALVFVVTAYLAYHLAHAAAVNPYNCVKPYPYIYPATSDHFPSPSEDCVHYATWFLTQPEDGSYLSSAWGTLSGVPYNALRQFQADHNIHCLGCQNSGAVDDPTWAALTAPFITTTTSGGGTTGGGTTGGTTSGGTTSGSHPKTTPKTTTKPTSTSSTTHSSTSTQVASNSKTAKTSDPTEQPVGTATPDTQIQATQAPATTASHRLWLWLLVILAFIAAAWLGYRVAKRKKSWTSVTS